MLRIGKRGRTENAAFDHPQRHRDTYFAPTHSAEDFKQGARLRGPRQSITADGALLKIPLC